MANVEGAEILAKAGADVNATMRRDAVNVGVNKGATALIKAAHNNNSELVAKLVDLGADVRATDRLGRTALHYAARNNPQTADLLIKAGADFLARDRFGKTALFVDIAPSNTTPSLANASPANSISNFVKDATARKEIEATNEGLMAVPENALDAETARRLVHDDVTMYKGVSDPTERHWAALAMADNADRQQTYREALLQEAPELAMDLGAAMSREAALVSEKEESKAIEVDSMLHDQVAGFDHVAGQRISIPHGDFLYLEGTDTLGDNSRAAVVPRAIDKPVVRFKDEAEVQQYLAEQGIAERERRAIDAFYSLSALKDRRAHEQITAPPENAIVAVERSVSQEAIRLDEYISLIENGTDNGLDLDARDDVEGPSTLLRGRFVRDAAGQYRRIGEERVALVDEGEKIRFVDKQFDTFQAATELASAKKWQAIQVTGTEQFRSEAWFAARLAGLDVIGYEPNEKDMARLEQAVSRGLAQAGDEPAPEVQASRTEAENLALKEGRGLQGPLESGSYKGKIVHETAHHVVQDIGRNVAVVHAKDGLDPEKLKDARESSRSVRVDYKKGRPAIAADREVSRESGLSR
ncbi:LPD7 domain-containing protein [Cupriavidus sp. D39]|uniref:LPD7 domain-containing protein n=1 Tax=Cupriavidus sp. D39 TaxID=2997877 RepID=UPI00226E4AD1|nr:LPD7 domain-containing protein [Cupriavidus sp. D39]MCY0853053.1 ankyrin repeat domain-containing protein [Cupriavidus sp. D39]